MPQRTASPLLLRRALQIFRVLFQLYRTAFFPWGQARRRSPAERAVLVRRAFEELGAVFIKFGQFLSMRPEFLPWEYCDELFFLLEDVPPFSFAAVEQVFRAEFRKLPRQIFARFEKSPFASASLGQVHRAVLKTGETVAVKVQRPGVACQIGQDLAIMKFVTPYFHFLRIFAFDIRPVLQEFERWISEEIHYEFEAQYTQEFAQNVQMHEHFIRIPILYPQFSTQRILTTEFIEGMTLNRILMGIRTHDRRFIAQIKKMGFDGEKVGSMLIRNSFAQFFQTGFFHADPHPANIIFTPEGKLAYIDFGIIGKLNKRLRLLSLRFARSVLFGDGDTAFEAYMQYNDVGQVTNLQALKKDHNAIVQKYQRIFQEQKNNRQTQRHFLGRFLFDGVRVSEKHKAIIPLEVLKFFRAISMFESILFYTDPEMTIAELSRHLRNFSLAALINDLPEIFSGENIENTLLQGIVLFERFLLKTKDYNTDL